MNTRLLEVLRAVLATGSATGAAKLLGITQSGVSRLLQQLENELKLVLFVREKGRLVATPEAIRLSSDIDYVMSSLDRFSNLARDLRSGATGPDVIRFGLPNSMSEVFAPRLLAAFKQAFPGVRFETFFDTMEANTRRVEQRMLEFAFVRVDSSANPQVVVEPFLVGKSVCVMKPDHPLAKKEVISPKDLRGQPLIMIGGRLPARTTVDEVFKRAGVLLNVEIETHSNSSACAYAAHGLGIGIISSVFADLFFEAPIVRRPFMPALKHEFGIVTAANVPLSIATRALIGLLKDQLIEREKISSSAAG